MALPLDYQRTAKSVIMECGSVAPARKFTAHTAPPGTHPVRFLHIAPISPEHVIFHDIWLMNTLQSHQNNQRETELTDRQVYLSCDTLPPQQVLCLHQRLHQSRVWEGSPTGGTKLSSRSLVTSNGSKVSPSRRKHFRPSGAHLTIHTNCLLNLITAENWVVFTDKLTEALLLRLLVLDVLDTVRNCWCTLDIIVNFPVKMEVLLMGTFSLKSDNETCNPLRCPFCSTWLDESEGFSLNHMY